MTAICGLKHYPVIYQILEKLKIQKTKNKLHVSIETTNKHQCLYCYIDEILVPPVANSMSRNQLQNFCIWQTLQRYIRPTNCSK